MAQPAQARVVIEELAGVGVTHFAIGAVLPRPEDAASWLAERIIIPASTAATGVRPM